MPQTFDAVRCAVCEQFQVQQRGATKKRWSCVVCGEKQSYTRVFFTSTAAKDVRPIVQQLNAARGSVAAQHGPSSASSSSFSSFDAPESARLRAVSHAERRVDASDGGAYTKEEFIEFYGSAREWEDSWPVDDDDEKQLADGVGAIVNLPAQCANGTAGGDACCATAEPNHHADSTDLYVTALPSRSAPAPRRQRQQQPTLEGRAAGATSTYDSQAECFGRSAGVGNKRARRDDFGDVDDGRFSAFGRFGYEDGVENQRRQASEQPVVGHQGNRGHYQRPAPRPSLPSEGTWPERSDRDQDEAQGRGGASYVTAAREVFEEEVWQE